MDNLRLNAWPDAIFGRVRESPRLLKPVADDGFIENVLPQVLGPELLLALVAGER